MRLSRLFGETLREPPSEARTKGHEYLLRGAYLRSLPDGSTAQLTLGQKTFKKIISYMRKPLEKIDAQEIHIIPSTIDSEGWTRTPPFHQVRTLAQKEIRSYRQLPQRIFQFQTRPVDIGRSMSNPLRMKATTSLECFSFDPNAKSSKEAYELLRDLTIEIIERFALSTTLTSSTSNNYRQSLLYLSPSGDQPILVCHNCSYLESKTLSQQKKSPLNDDVPKPLEKVATPRAHTIADLAAFLQIPESKTAKAIFSIATFQKQAHHEEQLIFSIVRGDMELNEVKLLQAIRADAIRPAKEEEITSIGSVPGFASPIGIEGALIVVDDLVPLSRNLVAGANEVDFHYLNTNYGRDYQADIIADIVQAEAGDPCPNCGNRLHLAQAIVLAEINRVPLEISDRFDIKYLDTQGVQQPVHLCTQTLDIHNLLSAISEEHHDEFGLRMPTSISPYQIHLIRLHGDEGQGDLIYEQLTNIGYEIIYDDRAEQPGVKFKDADLIGIPIRITIGKRSLAAGGAEAKLRHQAGKKILPLEKIPSFVESTIVNLTDDSRGPR